MFDKKNQIFFIFYIVSIISLFFINNNIICSDVLPYEHNIFFNKAKNILDNIRQLKDEIEKNNQDNIKIDKELEVFFIQLSYYRFSFNSMSAVNLEGVFKQITNKEKTVFTNNLNITNDNITNDKIKNNIVEFFNFLRLGIIYRLCCDHLGTFRSELISQLKEIRILIDYWTFKFNDSSLISRIQDSFDNEYVQQVSEKINDLRLLSDWMFAFLGKSDELFLNFFEKVYSGRTAKTYSQEDVLNNADIFIKNTLFLISCFFTKSINPDLNTYEENFTKFAVWPTANFVEILCKNHSNIFSMKNFFEGQLEYYQIPSFIERHWLILSCSSIVALGGGILIYKNWDNLFSDSQNSVKSKLTKFTKDSYIWITDKMDKTLDNFWPGSNKKANNVSFADAMKDPLAKLNYNREDFDKKYKEKWQELKEKGLVKSNEYDREQIFEALKSVENEGLKDAEKKIIVGQEGLKGQNEVLKGWVKKLKEDTGGLKNLFGEDWDKLKKFFDALQNLTDQNSENKPKENKIEENKNNKNSIVENGLWGLGSWAVSTKTNEAVGLMANFALWIAAVKEKMKKEGVDIKTINLLGSMVEDVSNIVISIAPQIGNLGKVGLLYQALVYKLVYDILNVSSVGMDNLVPKIDGMARVSEATLNWIVTLTALVVAVSIPISAYLVYDKVTKNKQIAKRNYATTLINEIFRVLNYYNKQATLDCCLKNLKYKDQGLISFQVEQLNEIINGLDKDDKVSLRKLIQDLQDPRVTVRQKIEFIKLEWGRNLLIMA